MSTLHTGSFHAGERSARYSLIAHAGSPFREILLLLTLFPTQPIEVMLPRPPRTLHRESPPLLPTTPSRHQEPSDHEPTIIIYLPERRCGERRIPATRA
jgi:hypothetical protein